MASFIFHIVFTLITIYALLQVIGFSLYEINELRNKSGGIVVITFSSIVVLFSNLIIWIFE